MTDKNKRTDRDHVLRKTIVSDFTEGNILESLRRDFKELYSFYIDGETQERLKSETRFKRFVHASWYLLKNLILKLTPARRFLLLLSIAFFLFNDASISDKNFHISIHNNIISYFLLLLVLMLELKDKLLAHDELRIGRTVQKALLPEENPTLSGWSIWLFTRPANDVGGDLVDYVNLDGNRLGLALGDVAGKGLGAALLMSKLQSTLRAIAPDYESLSELGERINTIFCRDSLPNKFATLVYIELAENSGSVRLLNAGHLPPLVLRGSNLEELSRGAPALGLLKTSKFEEQKIEMNPGDLLVAYSDGVTEARNERDEFFGDQRLRSIIGKSAGISPDRVGERILENVERFVGEAPRSDDLSMVIIKRWS
ncbi:MAG TPA: PP2C family protein-serine/threonine phosphatase [Candidatus Acidoferrales bacterium]|nr:PP2C family protein-serine/threonine phosphatase [Candidatus Acidoferrales bacterium]